MKYSIAVLLFLSVLVSCTTKEEFRIESPSGINQINISNKDAVFTFSVIRRGDTILAPSPLGLMVNQTSCVENVTISNFNETQFDETWTTVNGKQPTVRNHYNEYTFGVSKADQSEQLYQLVFRVYDGGFAYRYVFPASVIADSVKIEKELTRINVNGDFTYWAYNGEHHNLGPNVRSETKVEEVRIPVVMELGNNSFMAIHEAEIIEFAPLSVNASAANKSMGFNINYSSREKAFKTSWRTFILGDKVGDLVESNLLVNLNEPCKIEDTSWIKPGKSLWDWRVWGYETEEGYTYGLNTESHKRFIDFAAENNIQYLLIDADWYGAEFNESSDPTSAREGINIEECMAYAKEKGVGVILYLNDVGAKKFGLERVLKQFSEWGAAGVKYGFMTGGPEEKVKHTREVVELCAKYKLTVNFHDGPIPPSGDRRTFPNLFTKEYGHAQADAMRSYFPETAVNQPLINMIAGPLDLTNGWFGLNNAHSRVKVFKEIPGTVVAEVAKLITIYTGCMVLPDSPEEYLKKDDLFDCIRQMPAQFDGLKVLDAQLDEYVCIARKAGDDWFIGSLTNREKRTITIDLSFLPEEASYEATLYEDAEDSHFLNNKESYKIRKQQVDSTTKLTITMSEGGGHAIFLKLNQGND
ncbi:glycoside hydrolase family 97 catalytic domain-containing protein [uncultured Draconibacterium sp.]|uniref:glycoside hydrolase family 97 protein n=1 Tax=uncultured Draconibacterium sp. TaxID=1573823 RepID=UPI0032606C9E